MIEAAIKVVGYDADTIKHIQTEVQAAINSIAKPGPAQIAIETFDLSNLLQSIKEVDSFMDEDRVDLVNSLMLDLDLRSARFVYDPSKAWSYALLTDQGFEYIGDLSFQYEGEWVSSFCRMHQPSAISALLDHVPIAIQLLAFFGQTPDEKLLDEFRSQRFSWVGLKEDVDREVFFTRDNIMRLWENPESASQYFISDRSIALKLAGYIN